MLLSGSQTHPVHQISLMHHHVRPDGRLAKVKIVHSEYISRTSFKRRKIRGSKGRGYGRGCKI